MARHHVSHRQTRKGGLCPACRCRPQAYACNVNEPTLAEEGNLRLAGLALPGWPTDPVREAAIVTRALAGESVSPYGATLLWFAMPPGDEAPARWECACGTAITGLTRAGMSLPDGRRLLIEDYRDLRALTLAHAGPVRAIPETWKRLEATAQHRSARLRPYWRVALRNKRLADGNLLPVTEISVFLDR